MSVRRKAVKASARMRRAAGSAALRAQSAGDFESLVGAIVQVHDRMQARAVRAVNVSVTLRNWLTGCYIREYELTENDRAVYGERLFATPAGKLEVHGVSNCRRQLYHYRDFYCCYPALREALSPQWQDLPRGGRGLRAKAGTLYPQSAASSDDLLSRLSYSYFEELIALDEPLKRAFYETECIRGGWSVRELKRQIAALYYERSGLSMDKRKLAERARAKAEPASPAQAIRDPYFFEFFGLKPCEVMSETTLEGSLLDKLKEFLMELGRGFCFEARQKRILIGDEHFFVGLAFCHRILKCRVLIELKVDDFNHEYLGQLNTYLNRFRANEMADGGNPPVGILPCAKQDRTLVEYALAGMDNRLFVSKYRVELPRKEDIRRFMEAQVAVETPPSPRSQGGPRKARP